LVHGIRTFSGNLKKIHQGKKVYCITNAFDTDEMRVEDYKTETVFNYSYRTKFTIINEIH